MVRPSSPISAAPLRSSRSRRPSLSASTLKYCPLFRVERLTKLPSAMTPLLKRSGTSAFSHTLSVTHRLFCRLTLTAYPYGQASWHKGDTPEATTGAQGRYSFANLASGSYQVRIIGWSGFITRQCGSGQMDYRNGPVYVTAGATSGFDIKLACG